jgi:small multidrug resistance pump
MMYGWIGYAWCIGAGSCSAIATLMIKISSNQPAGWGLIKLSWLAAAAASYAVGFVAYSQALAKLQMTVAYPVMTALTMLLVACSGTMLLGEPMGLSKLAGMLLLCVACMLLTK